MDYTQLVGLSRQTALKRELDVVANNIANVNTTGFKADGSVFAEFLQSGASAGLFTGPDRQLSLVQDRMTWTDMSPGAMQQTGNSLDVALDGDGFLVVQTEQGERYTRNGALQINASGELVTSAGYKVMGESGPIILNSTDRDITINPDGSIRVREGNKPVDASRGKLRLVQFAQPQLLRKDGASTFSAPEGVQAQPATNTRVIQGALERSNVRSVVEMSRMIELTRAYTEIANLLQKQSDIRTSAISKLAEVPA